MDRLSALKNALAMDPRLNSIRGTQMREVINVVDELIRAHVPPCLYKADEQEPVFVLRAQDVSAPMALAFWVTINEGGPDSKIESANKVMYAMTQWASRKAAD